MKRAIVVLMFLIFSDANAVCDVDKQGDDCPSWPPPWVTYCTPRWALNLACTRDMFLNGVYTTIPAAISSGTTLPAYIPQAMGTAPAAITGAFASILLSNIANNAANLDAQIQNGIELLPRMSTELQAYDTVGATQQILMIAAQSVSASSLQYLAATFGPAAVAAVIPYAPPQVQAAYYALPTPAPLPFSAYYYGGPSPLTGSSSYLMDIWLETYFLGTDTVLIAQHKTQQYAMSVLGTGNLQVVLVENPGVAPGTGLTARLHARPAEAPYGGVVLFWFTLAVQIAQLLDPNLSAQLDGAIYAISTGAIIDGFNAANTYGWTMAPWGSGLTDPYSQPWFPPEEDGDNAYPMGGCSTDCYVQPD